MVSLGCGLRWITPLNYSALLASRQLGIAAGRGWGIYARSTWGNVWSKADERTSGFTHAHSRYFGVFGYWARKGNGAFSKALLMMDCSQFVRRWPSWILKEGLRRRGGIQDLTGLFRTACPGVIFFEELSCQVEEWAQLLEKYPSNKKIRSKSERFISTPVRRCEETMWIHWRQRCAGEYLPCILTNCIENLVSLELELTSEQSTVHHSLIPALCWPHAAKYVPSNKGHPRPDGRRTKYPLRSLHTSTSTSIAEVSYFHISPSAKPTKRRQPASFGERNRSAERVPRRPVCLRARTSPCCR